MKILIVKTSALGDIIQTFEVIEYLKLKYFDSEIDWVTAKPGYSLVESHPLVDNVLCYKDSGFIKKLRSKLYDVVFDLQGNCKSAVITFLAKAKKKVGFGSKSVSEWPNLLVTNFKCNVKKDSNIRVQYLDVVKKYFNDLDSCFTFKKRLLLIDENEKSEIDDILKTVEKKRMKVLVCPFSRWKNKELDISSLVDFLKRIPNAYFFFLWGNEREQKIVNDLKSTYFEKDSIILDKRSLAFLQNFMDKMDLVVAMDSFALHLCATVENTLSFSFFGPTNPVVYKPFGKKHYAVCGKCFKNEAFNKRCSFLRTCIKATCMLFDMTEVYDRFVKWQSTINLINDK